MRQLEGLFISMTTLWQDGLFGHSLTLKHTLSTQVCVCVNKNDFLGIKKYHVSISNGKECCNNFEANYLINTGLMLTS